MTYFSQYHSASPEECQDNISKCTMAAFFPSPPGPHSVTSIFTTVVLYYTNSHKMSISTLITFEALLSRSSLVILVMSDGREL
jgi:hypothetical protein